MASATAETPASQARLSPADEEAISTAAERPIAEAKTIEEEPSLSDSSAPPASATILVDAVQPETLNEAQSLSPGKGNEKTEAEASSSTLSNEASSDDACSKLNLNSSTNGAEAEPILKTVQVGLEPSPKVADAGLKSMPYTAEAGPNPSKAEGKPGINPTEAEAKPSSNPTETEAKLESNPNSTEPEAKPSRPEAQESPYSNPSEPESDCKFLSKGENKSLGRDGSKMEANDRARAIATAEDYDDRLKSLSLSNGKEEEVDTPQLTLTLDKDSESEEASNIKTVIAADTPYNSAKSFDDLSLSENLLRGLYSEMKFERPSMIQAETLPMILTPPHHDLIAQAHNGSGKTTCFVLGMLSRVDPDLKAPQAICVCPTRELAIQNQEVLMKMGKFTGITSICAVRSDPGDYARTRQRQIIEQVVIGTPGTIKRWITYRNLNTRDIKILVFDEADHMLDEDGFRDDSMRIHRDITRNRGGCQILLFSATFNDRVKQFATSIVRNANQVFVKKEDLSLDVIRQYRVKCPDSASKIILLRDTIFPAAEKLGQSIIFVRSRASASELHRILDADGHRCTSIHGGLDNELRDKVIREFRSGQTKIMISTDVLARGFDQAQVTLVVNFDLPLKQQTFEPDYELYLHRIGRSGRFGRKGAAFNLLVSRRDEQTLDKIERHFNRYIPEVPLDDVDAFERVLKEAGLA